MAEPDLSSNIADSAAGPKALTTEAGTVTEHDLTQQVEADKYLRQKAAAANPFSRLCRALLVFGRADGGSAR